MIIATKKGMSEYTTKELYDYVKRMDAKYEKAPKFIKRTSLMNYKSNAAAISNEISRRLLAEQGLFCG